MIALGAVIVAVAQKVEAPASNAILVSQTRDGNVVTSHYKIPHDDGKQAGFDVHYAINKANIVESYSDNPQQIAELKDFMDQTKDTTMHITAIILSKLFFILKPPQMCYLFILPTMEGFVNYNKQKGNIIRVKFTENYLVYL